MKAIIVLAILALVVVGCGKSEPAAPTTSTAPSPAQPAPPSQPSTPVTEPTQPEPAVTTPAASSTEIIVQGNKFSDDMVTIAKGTTVTFRAGDARPHVLRVTEVGGSLSGASPRLEQGGNSFWEYTFTEPGEYQVFDSVLKARLTVTVEE